MPMIDRELPFDTLRKERNRSPKILVLAIILIAVLMAAAIAGTISTVRPSSTQTALADEVLDAVNYTYRNYNATIGLNYNSPDNAVLRNTYWVYSDNYLASYVLNIYDPANTSLTSRAENLKENMTRYLNCNEVTDPITDPINQYMVFTESKEINESWSYFHGSDPPGILLANRDNDSAIKTHIMTHINNLTNIHPAPEDYTDIAFLQVVYNYNLSRWGDANYNYSCGIADWDGRGFADKAFAGEYQTYKLALYIYASKLLGLDYNQQAFDTLLAMQQPDGGFKTGYDSSLNPQNTSTNMETTSLAILALMEPMHAPIPEFGMMPLMVMVFVMAAIVVAGETRRKKG